MNFKDDYPGEQPCFHVDRASVITVRMPTADECAHGYPQDEPVLVVADGVQNKVFPCWMSLTVDDPHGPPAPDAVRDALALVLGNIGEKLDLAAALVGDMAEAASVAPCRIVHLAAKVADDREREWHCADASMCQLISPAVSAT